jgi:hypothetical protein
MSLVSLGKEGPNHLEGAITLLSLDLFNQAPHQLKEEFAIM